MANLKLKYDDTKGYYDIFSENGSLAKTKGLDSQILMSLFVDKRASDSEIKIKELQRGWAGNVIISDIPYYEIGCKQWLYIEQGKLTQQTVEKILDTIKNDGFQWLLDDGYAKEIELENRLEQFEGKIFLTFTFKIDENNIEKRKVVLWQNSDNP